MFSPKIDIINHFDDLINRIDIDIDSSLEKYNDQQLLSEILQSSENNRKNFRNRFINFDVKFFKTFDSSKQKIDSWTESTKVADYLQEVRMETIDELRKAQEESLEYYTLNSARYKREQSNEKNTNELFVEKFYFQVNFKQSEKRFWAFDVFTFVTDFYMSPSDIVSLEKLINGEREPFGQQPALDDKIILTGLLYKCFINNLSNFPNHLIHVHKQYVLNIESIKFDFKHKHSGLNLTSLSSIDLSKLVNIRINDRHAKYASESAKPVNFVIEGLHSLKTLHLEANTSQVDFSIKNLPSLESLSLYVFGTIDEDIVTRLLCQVQHIQEIFLEGNLSHFNLDHLVNLRVLKLYGNIDENFNFELFKNLCKQLEEINIDFDKFDEITFVKLFDGYNFPYLVDFTVRYLNMKRLRKEFIKGFPMLKNLNISNSKINEFDRYTFSNLEQLSVLNLSGNRIEYIEENAFSSLKNLQKLDLRSNFLRCFDPKVVGLRKSVEFRIEDNNF